MKIKMLNDTLGSCNQSGNATKMYKQDEIVDCNQDWEVALANNLVSAGVAMELKVDEPKETKKKKVVKKKTTKSK